MTVKTGLLDTEMIDKIQALCQGVKDVLTDKNVPTTGARFEVEYEGMGDSGGISTMGLNVTDGDQILNMRCVKIPDLIPDSWAAKGKTATPRSFLGSIYEDLATPRSFLGSIYEDLLEVISAENYALDAGGKGSFVIDLETEKLVSFEHGEFDLSLASVAYSQEDLYGTPSAPSAPSDKKKPTSGALPEGWHPMQTAPRDGTKILAFCRHADDPYVENEDTGRLTIYGAHAEGMSHAEDGPHVVQWGGEYCEEDAEQGLFSRVFLPSWWFVAGTHFEVVANPVAWMPIPAAGSLEGA